MGLNKGQAKVAKYISNWWQCNSTFIVLDSKGGTGKTFLIDYMLPMLKNCDPLLLTPTNESLKQLRDKLSDPDKYILKTVHSALGIRPTTGTKDLQFKAGKIPDLASQYNLLVIDEASMISEEILTILMNLGVKIFWVGHSSQLPPVVLKRKRNDLCISPVFAKDWETITLTEPMRNTGELWEFNNIVESMIYEPTTKLPPWYDVRKKELTDYLNSEQGKKDLLSGDTKIVLWSNAGVDKLNHYIRGILHGAERAKSEPFIIKDQIILTKPYNMVENLDRYRESGLKSIMNDEEAVTPLYSNTKAEVLSYKEVTITLNKFLSLECYKIKVECEGDTHYLYQAKHPEDLERVADHYEHEAWTRKTPATRTKAYKQRHFILSCFAEIKHYFAATSHRLQGASIPTIVVIYNDILKNSNRVERSKCLYVSTSRTIDKLMIFRGFI